MLKCSMALHMCMPACNVRMTRRKFYVVLELAAIIGVDMLQCFFALGFIRSSTLALFAESRIRTLKNTTDRKRKMKKKTHRERENNA